MRRTAQWLSIVNTLAVPTVKRQQKNSGRAFDTLVAKAEKDTGVSASLIPGLLDSYRFLLDQFAAIETMSFIGWKATLDDLQRRITSTLRMENLHRRYPSIADEPIESPIFVVGLPRTATTLAHKILTSAEGTRAPLMWELMNPDRPDADPKIRAARIKTAQQMASLAGKASPIWDTIHPLDAMSPEECVFAMPHSYGFSTHARIPEYNAWLARRDTTEDYDYMKKLLQLLQWKQEPKRWILKAPFHLFNLDVILKVFPDATILWLHRDPSTVMGSWCSLVETGTALHTRSWDPTEIGPEWLDLFGTAVASARRVRDAAPRDQFIDLGYHALTARSETVVPEIFAKLGLNWDTRTKAYVEQQQKVPSERRKHEYDLSRYGISHEDIDKAFPGYSALSYQS